MANSYDTWLTTTPEDEEYAAAEREKRREAAAERKLEAATYEGDDFRRARWTEADFIYDPLSKTGFE